MRTHSRSLPKRVATNDPIGRNALDELLNTLVVMRWDLNNALHDAGDAPQVVTSRLKQLRRELDASIAVLKEAIQQQRLSRPGATLDS